MQFIRSRSTKYKGYVKEMEKRKRIEINGTERERERRRRSWRKSDEQRERSGESVEGERKHCYLLPFPSLRDVPRCTRHFSLHCAHRSISRGTAGRPSRAFFFPVIFNGGISALNLRLPTLSLPCCVPIATCIAKGEIICGDFVW